MTSKNQEVTSRIEIWLSSITSDWPIAAAAHSPFEISLRDLFKQSPDLTGTEVEAALWLRLGLIDRAHEIVQDGKRGTAAYLHGVVHRLEGDYWNSKYWFRQVRDESLLKTIGTKIIHSLEDSRYWELALELNLILSNQFQFDAFVDTCATLMKTPLKSDTTASMVQQIVKSEWLAMLGILR